MEFAEICHQGAVDVDEDEATVILAKASPLHVVDEVKGSEEVMVVEENLILLQKMTMTMKMKSSSTRSKIYK